MANVCVYCGSSPGRNKLFAEAAAALGRTLAGAGFGLVYGGAQKGLMGILADAALSAGAEVTGVIPISLHNKEIAHEQLTKLHVVGDMHERKALMAELSDAFIAMPGGYGTLEELAEALTWATLGFHDKPVAVLNTDGYFNNLLRFLDRSVDDRFLRQRHRDVLLESDDPSTLLELIGNYRPPSGDKWID